jgi:hypothetical protein
VQLAGRFVADIDIDEKAGFHVSFDCRHDIQHPRVGHVAELLPHN